MTRDDIIEAASKAGFETKRDMVFVDMREITPTLTRFAALVAAAERSRMIADGWRQCAQGQRTTQFCGMVEQEREAAVLAAGSTLQAQGVDWQITEQVIRNIRARGQPTNEDNPSF